jgi:hypothetical protein
MLMAMASSLLASPIVSSRVTPSPFSFHRYYLDMGRGSGSLVLEDVERSGFESFLPEIAPRQRTIVVTGELPEGKESGNWVTAFQVVETQVEEPILLYSDPDESHITFHILATSRPEAAQMIANICHKYRLQPFISFVTSEKAS